MPRWRIPDPSGGSTRAGKDRSGSSASAGRRIAPWTPGLPRESSEPKAIRPAGPTREQSQPARASRAASGSHLDLCLRTYGDLVSVPNGTATTPANAGKDPDAEPGGELSVEEQP